MARDILDTSPLLERPEPQASVVASGDEFAAVGRKREGGDGGGVGEHVISALSCISSVHCLVEDEEGSGEQGD